MTPDTPNTPDSKDQETGQLSNQPAVPAGRIPAEKSYVGLNSQELAELGAETSSGGDSGWYQRQDNLELKAAIVARDNVTAEAAHFAPDTDQRGEGNDIHQRAEDGDARAVDADGRENPGLDDPGDGDPATSVGDSYENQDQQAKPRAERQHGSESEELPDEKGTTPDSNNSQQGAKLG
jgi:hypothetical protein